MKISYEQASGLVVVVVVIVVVLVVVVMLAMLVVVVMELTRVEVTVKVTGGSVIVE